MVELTQSTEKAPLPTISERRFKLGQEAILNLIAAVIGVLAAFAAIGFDKLVHLVDSFVYGSDHISGLYGGHNFLLIFLPAAGALLAAVIVYFFSHEACGHGVPEVMDAMVRRQGKIGFKVAVIKIISSTLTIGSGGSAGPEGPIIQIGAAIGSSTGSRFHVVRHHLPTLAGCGAAAGIAAIFNAPIAGVLFVLEVFIRDVNFKTLSPVLVASVISSVVTSSVLGQSEAIFPLTSFAAYSFVWYELPNYILLGLLCALIAVGFAKMLYATEDFFEKLKLPFIVKPVLGAVGLGAVGLITMLIIQPAGRGEPLVFGTGYSFIGYCIGTAAGEEFAGFNFGIGILLLLIVAKIVATAFTLGSGGSGGIFAPALFLGAVFGYSFGLIVNMFGWLPDVNPATYGIVGMASVIAAASHAPMTSIVMIFEITRNYTLILPVMFSVTIALMFSQLLQRQSINALKLQRLGVQFGVHAKTALLRRYTVSDIMQPDFVTVDADMSLQEIIMKTADADVSDFIVTDHQGHYHGLLTDQDLRNTLLHPEAIPLIIGEELVRPNIPIVTEDETLDNILNIFSSLDVYSLPVCDELDKTRFVGMIRRTDLMKQYMQALKNLG